MMNNTTNKIVIRKATISDAENLAKTHIEAWTESYGDIIAEEDLSALRQDPEVRARWKKRIETAETSNVVHLLIEIDGIVAGLGSAGPSRDSSEFKGEIYALYILKKFQKRGLGSMLWVELTHQLKNKNLFPFVIWALKENKFATSFYPKNGGKLIKATHNLVMGTRSYEQVGYAFQDI